MNGDAPESAPLARDEVWNMDGNQLDAIARGLAREAPRRSLLAGLAAGTLALLSGGSTSAVKRRKRRGKGKDGDETETALPPGTLAGGIWEETIDICHFDPETGEYQVRAIPTPTVPEYLNQGDTLFIDCCVGSDCSALPCLTPTDCIEGACMYDPAPGQPCALNDGATGVCDDDGVCVVAIAGETTTTTNTGEQPLPAPTS